MARSPATKSHPAARVAVRCGRPPRELAGEVDERILEAARKVFLERGFEGASVEEIAEAARSGKPTIYARYPNKQALFAAAYTSALAARNGAPCKPYAGRNDARGAPCHVSPRPFFVKF